jgi:hypothetical protein
MSQIIVKGKFVRDAMQTACGMLLWTPDVFWRATPFDLACAVEGYCRIHGINMGASFSQNDVECLRFILENGFKKKEQNVL